MKPEHLFRPAVLVLAIASALMLSFGTSCGQLFSDLKHDSDDSAGVSPDFQGSMAFDEEPYSPPGNGTERGNFENSETNADEKSRNLTPDRTERKSYKYGARATRDDFIDQSQAEGSLWASSGQTNYYFTKNKIRSPGDIVTMSIENDLYRDIGIEVKRTLSPHEKMNEVKLVRDQMRLKYLAAMEKNITDKINTSAAAPEPSAIGTVPVAASGAASPTEVQAAPSPGPQLTAPQLTAMTPQEMEKKLAMIDLEDVDIFPSLSLKSGDPMLGEIIGRYSNGNYKIRTVKRIPYKHGSPRMVSVVGVVKATDINEETDTVSSGKLYEYRVEVAH